MAFIKDLKRNQTFQFNDKIYKVRRKFTKYKNEEPHLLTECGQIFYFDELEITIIP